MLRPEGKRPDTSRLDAYAVAAASGRTVLWHGASRRTVPWQASSELSRLRPKRLVHLEHPNAQDANFFFPDGVLIATEVAGMGIDFPFVVRVIQWTAPSTLPLCTIS